MKKRMFIDINSVKNGGLTPLNIAALFSIPVENTFFLTGYFSILVECENHR